MEASNSIDVVKMAEKISPYVDMAFKKIFGVEENKDLLISLINAILKPEDAVEEITLLNPYLPLKTSQKISYRSWTLRLEATRENFLI
jgi:hypothetical protein